MMRVRNCPRCDVPLQRAEVLNAAVYECQECGGVWIDVDAFAAICADSARRDVFLLREPGANESRRPFDSGHLPCAACGRAMRRFKYVGTSTIELDICDDHGIWLDHAELRRVVEFVQAGRLKAALELPEPKPFDAEKHLAPPPRL